MARIDIESVPTAPVNGTNEQQTITKSGTVTAGNFRLKYKNQRTAPLAWNSTATQIRDALRALVEIGTTGISGASGGPVQTTPVVVTYAAGLGLANVAQLTVENVDLVGGGTFVVTTNVAGVTATGRGRGRGAMVVTEDTGKLYINEGTAAAPDWALVTSVQVS